MSCYRVLPVSLSADDPVEASHHLHLEPAPRLVAEARSFVAGHAPPLSEDLQDALLLLTSELVTNAVIHARTPLEVGITVSERSVLVTVHDQDLAQPEQQPYADREGGWGLGLVDALAEDAAMTRHEADGKTAWFRLSRDGSGGALGVVDDEPGGTGG